MAKFISQKQSLLAHCILLALIVPFTQASADPYSILGVRSGVSQEELKKAYRAKARELMSRVNARDSAAEEQLKEVNNAYDQIKSGKATSSSSSSYSGTSSTYRPNYYQQQYRYQERRQERTYREREDFRQDWGGATHKSPYADAFSTILNPEHRFMPGGEARILEALNQLEGIEWTKDARSDYLSRAEAMIETILQNPESREAIMRIVALMSSPFAKEFPEVIERLLSAHEAVAKSAASHLLDNKSLREHPRFLSWFEQALRIPHVHGSLGPSFSHGNRAILYPGPHSSRGEADPKLIKALLLYVRSMGHSGDARNLIMYMYNKPEHLQTYKPVLRLFYRSEAFIDHFTWGSEKYGEPLMDLFRAEEPQLTKAFEKAREIKTPYNPELSGPRHQAIMSEYQERRKALIHEALLQSEAAFQEWLASDPFNSARSGRGGKCKSVLL